MEIRDRELTLAAEGKFAFLNSQPAMEFSKLLVEAVFALGLYLDNGC